MPVSASNAIRKRVPQVFTGAEQDGDLIGRQGLSSVAEAAWNCALYGGPPPEPAEAPEHTLVRPTLHEEPRLGNS